MTKYIYQLPDWPRFFWDLDGLANQLAAVRLAVGPAHWPDADPGFRPAGASRSLTTLTEEILKSSDRSREKLDKEKPCARRWRAALAADARRLAVG